MITWTEMVGTKGLEVRWTTVLYLEGENDEEVRRVYRDVWERMREEREAARERRTREDMERIKNGTWGMETAGGC